ncbi:MAG: HpaII family restriction endonuclease [Alphaproteobacteria bacterium]|nr:HpaII family restriction endonuclease [Alphaproteobacteria bacterium]
MQTFNKGEWSESYCILRVISEKKLNLCNADLSLNGEVVNVLGGKISDGIDYVIDGNNIRFSTTNGDKEFSLKFIESLAENSFKAIKSATKRTFPIPEIENFFLEIGNKSIKAKSSNKIDVLFSVFDDTTSSQEKLGFSIKSFVAGSPTLINASKATNFTYNINLQNVENKYKELKAKRLVNELCNNEIDIVFDKMDGSVYKKNLMRIDLKMPEIISEVLKIYFSSRIKSIRDIILKLQDINPLKLDDVSLYEYKIADFLFYSAVGMFPNTEWEGIQDVDGGCLIVKDTGQIGTFYIFRKKFLKFFKEYLVNKCFLDTASTTRHGFARLYEENSIIKLKLNLQIRIEK